MRTFGILGQRLGALRERALEPIRLVHAGGDEVDEAARALLSARNPQQQAMELRRFLQRTGRFGKRIAAGIKALEQRVSAIEEELETADAQAGRLFNWLGFGEAEPALVGALNAWMVFINKDDPIPNPTAFAMAEAIEQFSQGRPDGPPLRILATLVRAYSYYDGAIGLSSIVQADGSTPGGAGGAGGTTGDDNADLRRILDYLLGQGEVTVIGFIENAATVLDIDIPEAA